MKTIILSALLLLIFISLSDGSAANCAHGDGSGPIFNGQELDYQPAIIRLQPSGDLMIVFERIEVSTFFGDLLVSFSGDNGASWSTPQPVIATSLNERHPALVQLGANSFVLFYLVDETGSGGYRIHRATSSDGLAWAGHGAVDLGWSSSGEINPTVFAEADGSLILAYQRLYGACHVARSFDDGATWDLLKTQISSGTAALPRITKRESDGVYLVTYQTGSSSVDIWAKTTTDPYAWPGTAVGLSTAINSHDPMPLVLEGGTFLVTYAQQVASVFDLYYRTGADGAVWSDAVRITSDTQHYDTQPHPLRQGTPGRVILAWSHQDSISPYVDHDVWVNDDLLISLPLWLDSDVISATSGAVIDFSLDAGASFAGRDYFLAGSMTGTSPGTTLPGGAVLPLNRDSITAYIQAHVNNAVFVDFMGTLDGNGRAPATLNQTAPVPLAAGTVLQFAFTTLSTFDFQSNPVAVLVVP